MRKKPNTEINRDESMYFAAIKKDCIRMYGKRGESLANRYWDIKDLTDLKFQEEKIKITYGLA